MDDVASFFQGPNAGYILELYERFQQDPDAVDAATRALFTHLPSIPVDPKPHIGVTGSSSARSAPEFDVAAVSNLVELARNIRGRGHLAARLDPLEDRAPAENLSLLASTYGLHDADLERLPASIVGGPAAAHAVNARDAISALRKIYEGTVGYDYNHVHDEEERAWLRDAVESGRFQGRMSDSQRRMVFERLTQVEAFEKFLHTAFKGQKRFSIEGNDMLVPMLDEAIHEAAASGTREVMMGMAHRGRLNVLAHVLEKPYRTIFTEFREASQGEGPAPTEGISTGWTGDVKYHLGARGSLHASGEARMSITLANNPSHLEFVDPVVEGMARSIQDRRDQKGAPTQDDGAALPILIHGDAAFPGEGVVAETLNFSRLDGYRTGGTIHIILNNKLGFTTEPSDARSTLYASDLAKGFEIPVIHVNADDVEACISATRLAYAYRATFRKDVLIDLIGYRRWGHNEGDEPAYTQPHLYDIIADHQSVRSAWAAELDRQGLLPLAESEAALERAIARLREINTATPTPGPVVDERRGHLADESPRVIPREIPTDTLVTLGTALLSWPDTFAPHPRLAQQLERKRAALAPDAGIDWGMAESLAFATVLIDGTPIRLTGQDSERGTFSQRHLVLHDATGTTTYTPLKMMADAQASFAVHNSPLSEAGALGFEYGYTIHAPETLVLWEAQFGDFANAGQVIIDQFIAAARAKWRQHSSLVLLLPHGYEGQGPEHSSARLERYLQLAAGNNMWVTYPTTPAQYFHLLRRQAALLDKDPRALVVMTPKSLLRKPEAVSPLADLASGLFQSVIDDPEGSTRRDIVTRLILCSGKIYYDLIAAPARTDTPGAAVVRVEELYPFPAARIEEIVASYPRVEEVVWVQEEPRNMGGWSYMESRLRSTLASRSIEPSYIGRPERASPAVGSGLIHRGEQEGIIGGAFSGVRTLQQA